MLVRGTLLIMHSLDARGQGQGDHLLFDLWEAEVFTCFAFNELILPFLPRGPDSCPPPHGKKRAAACPLHAAWLPNFLDLGLIC